MTEVEAKFSVPDRITFDRLRRLDQLAGFCLEPAGVKRVHDRYLDTEDRAILKAGYACRLRSQQPSHEPGGEGIFLATLKGLGGADAQGAIHQRAEYEVPVSDENPATWPRSRARDLALDLGGRRALYELFSLRQERHLGLLYRSTADQAPPVAEFSLDVVTLGGRESRPFHELEIELLGQNGESDLEMLVAYLRTTWGLQPEPRSKFERGLELIDHSVQGP